MKNETINYVAVGAFVIAMLIALVISIAVLTGRTGVADTYYTSYSDVTGLKYGSTVLYMGFPVGQVEAIQPMVRDSAVEFVVEMSIDEAFRAWKVPVDSVAHVRAAGLLAAVTIDIRAGNSTTSLKPGDRIEGRGQVDVFAAVSETANSLRELTVSSVQPLIENLSENVARFGEVLDSRGGPLLDNLTRLAEQLAERAPEIIDDFLRTTADLRSVSARLTQVLSDENTAKLGSVMDNLVLASEDLARLSGNARGQLEVLLGGPVVSRFEQLTLDAAAAAADLRELGATARANAERVLSAANAARIESSLENLERASASARELVGTTTRAAVDTTLDNVQAASVDLKALISDTREQVTTLIGPETQARLNEAVGNVSMASANIAELSANLDARLGEVLTADMAQRLKRALDNFSRAAGNIAALTGALGESRRRLDTLLANLDALTVDNRDDLRASLRALRHTMRAISQNVDSVVQNIEGTSRNMFELTRRLKTNPGLLLRTPVRQDDAGAAGGG